MNRLLLSILSAVYCFILSGQAINYDSVTVARFGKVHIYTSDPGIPGNVIIMISGDAGWKYGVPEFAKEFSTMQSIVVGVNILEYYRHLRALKEDCYMVASDFAELATAVERKYNLPKYIPPVLMGYSSGASLVYGILAQAHPGSFIGGISLGFCPEIEFPGELCHVNGRVEKETVNGKISLFLPSPELAHPWVVLQGKKDKICDFQMISSFVSKSGNSRIIALPQVGHDFSRWSDFMPQWKSAFLEMQGNYNSSLSDTDQPRASNRIVAKTYPGIDGSKNNLIALLFSGDGGWYGFEHSISERLAKFGISVIGIDTRKYLWSRKTPEEAASEIKGLLNIYSKDWNRFQYMLVGYSQGAEIVPFIFTRLPEEMKTRVTSIVMLSPGTYTDFEVHISNMIGIGNKQNKYNVVDEISRILNTRQICIFGANESTKVPELLKNSQVETCFIPGDHHYKGNSELIVQTMRNTKAF